MDSISLDKMWTSERLNFDVSDSIYIGMALFMFVVFITGVIFNGIFIYILLFNKRLRSRNNVYIISLCTSSLLIAILAVPFVGASAMSHHWLFGKSGCLFHGFAVTWLGLIQICLLSVVSFERYLVVVKRKWEEFLTKRATITLVFVCIIYAGMLAVYPLFGWNEFTLEVLNISCAINIRSNGATFHSYVLCLLVMGLVVPLGIMIFSYVKVFMMVRRRRLALEKHTIRNDGSTRRAKEMKVVKTIFLLVCAFIVSWLPYAIYLIINMIFTDLQIHPILETLPSLFAKSSIIWNPVIYLLTNTSFKKAFMESLPPCTGVLCNLICFQKRMGIKYPSLKSRSHACLNTHELEGRENNNNKKYLKTNSTFSSSV